jgi:hypothetical protein
MADIDSFSTSNNIMNTSHSHHDSQFLANNCSRSLSPFFTLVRPMWCGVVWCGVVWCGVVWYGVLWCVLPFGGHQSSSFFCNSRMNSKLSSHSHLKSPQGRRNVGKRFVIFSFRSTYLEMKITETRV